MSNGCIPRDYIDTIFKNIADEIEAIENYKKMYDENPREDIKNILYDEMEHRDTLLGILIEALELNERNDCEHETFYKPVRF